MALHTSILVVESLETVELFPHWYSEYQLDATLRRSLNRRNEANNFTELYGIISGELGRGGIPIDLSDASNRSDWPEHAFTLNAGQTTTVIKHNGTDIVYTVTEFLNTAPPVPDQPGPSQQSQGKN